MQNNKKFRTLITILFAAIGLSGCSTYSNKFKGDPAKGLWSTMVRDVDIQIDSGQIEEIYKNNNKRRGKAYPAVPSDQSLLKLAPKNKAPIYDIESEVDIIDKENNLYF
jgi:hypothetical protein